MVGYQISMLYPTLRNLIGFGNIQLELLLRNWKCTAQLSFARVKPRTQPSSTSGTMILRSKYISCGKLDHKFLICDRLHSGL